MLGDPHLSTHPPLPPTTEDDRVSWIRLLRSRRITPQRALSLIAEHGSAAAAVAALPEIAKSSGMQGYMPCQLRVARAELRAGKAAGAQLVLWSDPAYPPLLKEILDAPPFLWVRGDLAHLQRPFIAIVGTREASSLGLRMAALLGEDLATAGYGVVSGLARGIDTAAHEGALLSGLTAGVLPGGVDVISPVQNAALADRIVEKGVLISEQPPGLQPQAFHFPLRNRLISGLACALVVVEATLKSGTMITARCALDQSRDVLAIPGHPLDPRASGSNRLISDGARLVTSAADILEGLPPLQPIVSSTENSAPLATPAPERRPWRQIAALHSLILERLAQRPMAEDELLRAAGATPQEAAPALLDLEMDGQITRHPGGVLARK